MSNINLKQCDQCGTMLDANSAFCGTCGKQFGGSDKFLHLQLENTSNVLSQQAS